MDRALASNATDTIAVISENSMMALVDMNNLPSQSNR